MAEATSGGQSLSVGFYIIDPGTREVLAGPYRTRLAATIDSGVVQPCCIMEVVGDWVTWDNYNSGRPGCWVPFDGIKSVELRDGRTVEPIGNLLGSPAGFPSGWIGLREVDHPSFVAATAGDFVAPPVEPTPPDAVWVPVPAEPTPSVIGGPVDAPVTAIVGEAATGDENIRPINRTVDPIIETLGSSFDAPVVEPSAAPAAESNGS